MKEKKLTTTEKGGEDGEKKTGENTRTTHRNKMDTERAHKYTHTNMPT